MKYALGNMLNGAGSINPDGLALDLQFAADKTLTARKGPTPTFTRSSSGTFVNANGLIVGKTEGTTASITPSTQAIGSQVTVTVASGSVVGWVIGQAIALIVDTDGQDDPDATELWLLGNIVSTTATELVFEVTSRTTQAGSATSWTLGYRGPRFDHDPATLASRGLLIEESRTNLILQSENHPSASWNKTGTTVAPVTHAAPDGNTSSNLVSEDASTGLHRLFQGTAYVSGTSYAISVFLKYAGRRFIAITHPAVAANGTAIFDIQNGSVTLQQSGITASMVQHPNGWWRCVVVGTSSTTSSQSHTIQGSTTGGSLTGSYTGLNGAAFYIYGSQVEAGSFATSYIPTTTASLARSADVCSISGAGFTGMWNALEGSLFTSAIFNAPVAYGAGQFLVDVNDTTTTNRLRYLRSSPASAAAFINTSGNVQNVLILGLTALQPFVTQKYSVGFKLNDYALYVNNSQIGTANLGAMIVSPTTLNIGDASAGAGRQYTNGTISAIRYYKKRLPNAKLQALTV